MGDLSWWKKDDTPNVYLYLRAQLDAINHLPYAKRNPYVRHEIRCRGCDCVLVQLVTLKYPDPDGTDCQVIRYRSSETLPLNLPDLDGMIPGEHGRLAAQAVAHRPESHRPGEWRFIIADDGDGSIFAYCNCSGHVFTEAQVLTRKGRKSTARPRRT